MFDNDKSLKAKQSHDHVQQEKDMDRLKDMLTAKERIIEELEIELMMAKEALEQANT